MQSDSAATRLLRRSSWLEVRHVAAALHTETVGGALLLVGAAVAVIWANSPWQSCYQDMRELAVGPSSLHLHLSLRNWASDGLLAIFFFVAGLELKRGFTVGELRDPRKAALPIAAAACGVALPAIVFTGVAMVLSAAGGDGDLLRGWAIPTATDIAFALAVLALLGTHLPSALRSFLLTLAVADDLIAIIIIAIFYGDSLTLLPLLSALIPLSAFWYALRHKPSGWILIPLALATWALVHASGIHATVAGIALGLIVPCRPDRGQGRDRGRDRDQRQRQRQDQGQRQDRDRDQRRDRSPGEILLADRIEHRMRPISAAIAVPIFALMAAGVGLGGFGDTIEDPAAVGVVAGLVVGKTLGIFVGSWLLARFTKATLDEDLAWIDVFGVAILGGIGFTVSLLITELAYGDGTPRGDHVKTAVLVGSLVASLLAAVVLRLRNRVYRKIQDTESLDTDADGIPDIYLPESET